MQASEFVVGVGGWLVVVETDDGMGVRVLVVVVVAVVGDIGTGTRGGGDGR